MPIEMPKEYETVFELWPAHTASMPEEQAEKIGLFRQEYMQQPIVEEENADMPFNVSPGVSMMETDWSPIIPVSTPEETLHRFSHGTDEEAAAITDDPDKWEAAMSALQKWFDLLRGPPVVGVAIQEDGTMFVDIDIDIDIETICVEFDPHIPTGRIFSLKGPWNTQTAKATPDYLAITREIVRS